MESIRSLSNRFGFVFALVWIFPTAIVCYGVWSSLEDYSQAWKLATAIVQVSVAVSAVASSPPSHVCFYYWNTKEENGVRSSKSRSQEQQH
jgi:hypothetical protein